mmetsp:Transcript_4633/g.7432  ORF Transcript_4633/g.7432 Transcript_4633/m.7432 type:complete len:200 (-) Transcript_4633:95-694(-)
MYPASVEGTPSVASTSTMCLPSARSDSALPCTISRISWMWRVSGVQPVGDVPIAFLIWFLPVVPPIPHVTNCLAPDPGALSSRKSVGATNSIASSEWNATVSRSSCQRVHSRILVFLPEILMRWPSPFDIEPLLSTTQMRSGNVCITSFTTVRASPGGNSWLAVKLEMRVSASGRRESTLTYEPESASAANSAVAIGAS